MEKVDRLRCAIFGSATPVRETQKSSKKSCSLEDKYIEALLSDECSLMKQSALAVVASGQIVPRKSRTSSLSDDGNSF